MIFDRNFKISMRTLIAAAALAVGGLVLGPYGPADAAPINFVASLNGGQEVPPNGSAANGTANLVLNDAQDRLEMTITINGLDLDGLQTPGDPNDNVVAMHIHNAPLGANGGVVFGLISPNNDLNGDLSIDPVAGTLFSGWDLGEGNGTTLALQLANLFAGDLYFNVHTPGFPGGEIRGQISAVPVPGALALFLTALAGLGLMRIRTA